MWLLPIGHPSPNTHPIGPRGNGILKNPVACAGSFSRAWKQSTGNDRALKHTRALHVLHAQSCEGRGLQRAWHHFPLGRCTLHSRTHARQIRPTPVALSHYSPVAWHSAKCILGRHGQRPWPILLARWLCQLLTPCPAEGFNARSSWSTRPLESFASYFWFWDVTILPYLKEISSSKFTCSCGGE